MYLNLFGHVVVCAKERERDVDGEMVIGIDKYWFVMNNLIGEENHLFAALHNYLALEIYM